jgi:hypothetical protein
MQDPVRQTGKWLKSIVQGHFNHYAVPGNIKPPPRIPGSASRALVADASPP